MNVSPILTPHLRVVRTAEGWSATLYGGHGGVIGYYFQSIPPAQSAENEILARTVAAMGAMKAALETP